MKTKRLLLAWLLASLLPFTALADVWQDPETKVNYEYEPGSGVATVKAGNSYYSAGSPEVSGILKLPDTIFIDGTAYVITSIGDFAFRGCTNLSDVTLTEGLTTIGRNAFSGCTSMTSITIPSSVTSWGNFAISGCTSLTDVTLTEGLTTIGRYAFEGCTSLTSITIPSSITSWGGFSFSGCTSLTDVTLIEGLTTIGGAAFEGCTSLTSITIPSSITSWGGATFMGCTNLSDVTLTEGLTTIGGTLFEGCTSLTSITIPSSITSWERSSFRGCTNLSDVILSEGLITIGEYAFSGCTSLTSITIPSSVTSWGGAAFSGCTNLTSIKIPSSVTSWGDRVFSGCSSLTDVTLTEGLTTIGRYAFSGCTSLTNITIPSSVTSWNYAFYGCTSLIDVTLTEGLSTIGVYAFSGCTSLTSITIPSSVTKWEGEYMDHNYAFKGCTNLSDVTLTEGLTTIGRYAFSDCTSLTSITIPSSITSWDYAFYGCTSLADVTLTEGLTAIGYGAFMGCTSLTSITIPSSVTSWNYAFSGCTNLTDITLTEGLTTIGSYAFNGCTSLTSITIPSSITSWSNAFSGCTSLADVTLTEGLTAIGYGAFMGCTSLTSITIPSSVTSWNYAFSGCTNLTDITLTEGLTTIGSYAFNGCTSLTGITIPSSITSWDYAFYGCTSLADVTLTEGLTTIGGHAFNGCTNLTSITIPSSVTHWSIPNYYEGNYAFSGCTNLSDVTLSEGLTTIGRFAFSDCTSLTSITIPSSITSWDYAFYGCTSLSDVTLTEGLTTIGRTAFKGCIGLTSITIPSSITSIGYNAFLDCTNLSDLTLSEGLKTIGSSAFQGCTSLTSIISFSLTPPTVDSRAFKGVGNCTVYVPVDAISLYQEAEGWKDFIILPLGSNEVNALEVNLPDGTDVNTYKDMFIELVNMESGQKQHYVITNRLTYTFNSLAHGSSYNVYLKNRQGDVLGEIDGIEIVDEDVSVTFPSLLVPRDVTLRVFTPQRQDVTNQAVITWFDQKDTYLTRGSQLTGQIEGAKVKFRIQLSQALGVEYLLPEDSLYEVLSANEIDYTLVPIPQTTISGIVRDAKTGMALKGATVTASQMLNGLYSKAFTTKTDAQGRWSLTVFEAKTDITVSMTDYVSESLSMETLTTEVPAFELKDISGTIISLNLTYTSTDGETQPFYSDYANVAYSVYNETTKETVEELSVQYPQIVLMDELAQGTCLRITATSKSVKFLPVTAEAMVDSLGRAEVTLPIVQLGGITATFRQTDNTSVVGILYDQNERFIKKYDYGSASLTIDELTDGDYTLVTMANSQFFNSVATISQFSEVGLKEGVDYVKNQVTVKSGTYTAINNQLIPYLDESKLYYTGESTSVAINKSQITVGNYLTISSRIDFKDAYANAVKDVRLIVDLPEACSFVQNSVMAGTSTVSYTYADHRLTIPLENYSDRVRFCFIPTVGGSYAPSASVQFILDGKEITQPIGNANFTAKDLSINVPATIARTTVTVSGTAIGKSKISVYDGNVLIGQGESLGNGTWAIECQLMNPYNRSIHSIHAEIVSTNNNRYQTGSKELLYDVNSICVSKVDMFYNNHSLKFDFLNPKTNALKYTYTGNNSFTFTIDFTNNDTTLVQDVNLRVKLKDNNWMSLPTNYDNQRNLWVSHGDYGKGNVPTNVAVAYNTKTEAYADRNEFDKIIENYYDSKNDIHQFVDSLNNLNTKYIADSLGLSCNSPWMS